MNRSFCRAIDLAMKYPKIVKLLVDHKDTAPSVAMDECAGAHFRCGVDDADSAPSVATYEVEHQAAQL
eukprot:1157200-Pelagomonas_calceolata.AAC.1